MQHERDRLAYSLQELERKLSEMTAHIDKIEGQRDEEARICHFIKVHTIIPLPFT